MKSGKTQEDYFRLIAENGAEGSDIMDPAAYPWFWTDFDSQKKNIAARMKAYGLVLSGYATGNNFAFADPCKRAEQVKRVKSALHTAAELGAPCLRIFGGYHEECGGEPGIRMHNGLAYVRECLEKVIPEAGRCGVTIALENHGRIPGLSAELLALTREFEDPYFRILFDCANFCANNMDEPEDPLTAYEVLRDKVVHCHVKSWRQAPPETGRRVVGAVAGTGGLVPLRRFFYKLAQDRYNGFCSLEYEAAKWTPEDIGVPESLRNLKEMRDTALMLYGEKQG